MTTQIKKYYKQGILIRQAAMGNKEALEILKKLYNVVSIYKPNKEKK